MVFENLSGREVHGLIIVLASVVVHIPVAGIINSFGVFVEQLNEEFCPFDCLQLLGWIGALTFGLNRAFCFMVVELQKVVSSAFLFSLGVAMCSTSLFLTSLADRLPWLFLFYCLIYGFGSSLVMNTPYALIEDIFPSTHRYHVTSTSIMNVGAPLGMLLVNPLVAYLDTVEAHTWRDTLRIFSLVVLITGLVCTLPMSYKPWYLDLWRKCSSKQLQSGRKGYEDLDKEASDDQRTISQGEPQKTQRKDTGSSETTSAEGADKNTSLDDKQLEITNEDVPEGFDSQSSSFKLLCGERTLTNLICWGVGMFFLSVAIFIPKVHFIQYMHDLHIDPETAAACMSYEGLAEAILSLMISLMGDPIAPYFLWMFALCSALLAVSSTVLVMSTRVIHIAIYCTIHGAVDGLLMTTIYPTLPLFVQGAKAKQALWSLTLFVTGIGQVVGLPMAGLVYDETQSYQLVFFIAAGVFGSASVAFLFIALRISNTGVVTEEDAVIQNPDKEHLALTGNNQDPSQKYSSTGETAISKEDIPNDTLKEHNGLPWTESSGKNGSLYHNHAPPRHKTLFLTADSKPPKPGTLLHAAMQGDRNETVSNAGGLKGTMPHVESIKGNHQNKAFDSKSGNGRTRAGVTSSLLVLDSEHGTDNGRLTSSSGMVNSKYNQETNGKTESSTSASTGGSYLGMETKENGGSVHVVSASGPVDSQGAGGHGKTIFQSTRTGNSSVDTTASKSGNSYSLRNPASQSIVQTGSMSFVTECEGKQRSVSMGTAESLDGNSMDSHDQSQWSKEESKVHTNGGRGTNSITHSYTAEHSNKQPFDIPSRTKEDGVDWNFHVSTESSGISHSRAKADGTIPTNPNSRQMNKARGYTDELHSESFGNQGYNQAKFQGAATLDERSNSEGKSTVGGSVDPRYLPDGRDENNKNG